MAVVVVVEEELEQKMRVVFVSQPRHVVATKGRVRFRMEISRSSLSVVSEVNQSQAPQAAVDPPSPLSPHAPLRPFDEKHGLRESTFAVLYLSCCCWSCKTSTHDFAHPPQIRPSSLRKRRISASRWRFALPPCERG